jgi:hypothetical protein
MLKSVPTRRWSPVVATEDRHYVSSAEFKSYPPQQLIECDLFSQQTTAGKVEVYYKKQRSLKRHGYSEDSDTNESSGEEKFSARIVFIPTRGTDLRTKVILNVFQESTSTGSLLSTPILSYRSIIPETSEVFQIVQWGTLRDLQKAFSEGTASVTDCDPDGRSLLNVSIKSSLCEISNKAVNQLMFVKFAAAALRPSMVRFLLEAGAEPNSVEMDAYGFLG